MLEAHIIEELRRREEKQRNLVEQPRLEMPSGPHRDPNAPRPPRAEESERQPRGVIVIDL